jgi:hypothetical protein
MVLSVPISKDVELKLAEKAAAAGVDVSTYVAALLEQSMKMPLSLREISGPIAEDFTKSGMTDDELGDFLEEAKHQMRAERRAGKTQ